MSLCNHDSLPNNYIWLLTLLNFPYHISYFLWIGNVLLRLVDEYHFFYLQCNSLVVFVYVLVMMLQLDYRLSFHWRTSHLRSHRYIYCVVFLHIQLFLCILCCQFLWIVHSYVASFSGLSTPMLPVSLDCPPLCCQFLWIVHSYVASFSGLSTFDYPFSVLLRLFSFF